MRSPGIKTWVDSTGATRIQRSKLLSDELLTNSDFSDGLTGFQNIVPTRFTMSASAGNLIMDATAGDGSAPAFRFYAPVVDGRSYVIEWDCTTTGRVGPYLNGVVLSGLNTKFSSGRGMVSFTSNITGNQSIFMYGETGIVTTWHSVSVRELL